MATTHTPWQNFEGGIFDGRYPLIAHLHSGEAGATFQTEAGSDRWPAAIRFVAGGPQDAAPYLSNWTTAASLAHPNLLSIYDYGHGVLDHAPVVFVVSAYPETRLADVLSRRALTEEETYQVAVAVAEALVYLHGQGLVHGSLDPSHLFAEEDQVKLSSDNVQAAGSPAGDIESFGLLLVQCLTRQLPDAAGSEVSRLPPRFRKIVENSLSADPSRRWTAARIRSFLQGEPEPVPEVEPQIPGRKLGYATIAAALFVLIAGGLYLANPRKHAAEPPKASAPAPVAQPHPVPPVGERARTTPLPSAAAKPLPGGNQFVIIATYNRREDAEKRATSITARWPKFPAEVQAPNRSHPTYLVTIGANLSKAEAAQLQRRARAAGLPRDTYFQSY